MRYLYHENIKKKAPSIPEECYWKDDEAND